MEQPLITAIIPTYKRPRLLRRAVRSILAQTFPHFEVLVADNSSGKETDDVVEALMAQDKRVKLLQHTTNIGLTGTLQSALMHVNTPYVCFLCDDDFTAPYFFEETLPFFSKYPEIAFSGGGAAIIDKQYKVKSLVANEQQIIPSGYYEPPKGFFAYLHSTFGIALSSVLIKTEILKKLGGFDLRIRNGSDEDPISKCAARYPIYLSTTRPNFFAFHHDTNLSSLINYPLFEKECECLYENLSDVRFSPAERQEVDRFFIQRRMKIFSSAFNYFRQKKEFQTAAHYAEKMIALTGFSRWKRKKTIASLSVWIPSLDACLMRGEHLEKRVRHFLKGNPPKKRIMCDPSVPEATRWKEYALQLEAD